MWKLIDHEMRLYNKKEVQQMVKAIDDDALTIEDERIDKSRNDIDFLHYVAGYYWFCYNDNLTEMNKKTFYG